MFIGNEKYTNSLHYNRLITPSSDKTDQFRKVGFTSFNMVSLYKKGCSPQLKDIQNKSVCLENNYMPISFMGSGATSFVFSAYQATSPYPSGTTPTKFKPGPKDTQVAIKHIKRIFDYPRFAHAILREIRLLRILRGHPNIIRMKTILRPKEPNHFDEVNIVMELCAQNLMRVIEFNRESMKTNHIQYISYEIAKGLLYVHSKGIIHRDLKPLNILITDSWEVKISDFGSANVKSSTINSSYNLTDDVTTRYYRAPESYLKYATSYGTGLDMWSFGCILAEMIGKQVFINADDDSLYVCSLLQLLGPPPKKILNSMRRSSVVKYINRMVTRVKHRSFRELLPDASDNAIDLISKLITWDPEERLTAREALQHPFFAELYDPKKDSHIIEGKPLKYFDFEFEQYTLETDILKDLILDEIIMANSKDARDVNRRLRAMHEKDGVLE
mmetsp:Transcript_34726/g.53306  ORF Transcript_34726/g.53306 Transcript_34726/m.53306 type:complete len:444 (-) Transcript_34726:514-1845(-)